MNLEMVPKYYLAVSSLAYKLTISVTPQAVSVLLSISAHIVIIDSLAMSIAANAIESFFSGQCLASKIPNH
jgi:hypothetical protein